ncbi:hypothetical protein FACS1894162_0810 [Bacteroidia bacterium]|nr:hypothetical protein FACS1894162_0810 [Bacteroidia bacterium]
MKKQIFLVLLAGLLSISGNSFAQKPDNRDQAKKERFEKFKASRKEFIAQKMRLTDSEKQSFFALDKELQTQKFELHKALREAGKKIRKAHQEEQIVSEADYKNLLDLISQTKLKEAQLEQEYTAKFLKVVSADKVYHYQRADQQFGEQLIRKK